MQGFAVNPRDFEKLIFLHSDGDVQDRTTEEDFRYLQGVCAEYGSHIVTVIDAEGEVVCFAPVAVARVIARLLNECADFGDGLCEPL